MNAPNIDDLHQRIVRESLGMTEEAVFTNVYGAVLILVELNSAD